MYDSGVAKGATLAWNNGIVLNTNGNVGIGPDSTPDYKLDVQGTLEGGTITEGGNAVYNTTETPTHPGLLLSGLTASEIVITDGTKNLSSAAVATYPSLAELAYIKGLSSALQTQLDLLAPLTSPTFLVQVDIDGNLALGDISSAGKKIIIRDSSSGGRYGIYTYNSLHLRATDEAGNSPALSFTYANSRGVLSGFKGVELTTYTTDLSSGDLHIIKSANNITSSNSEQAFLGIYPNVNQTGTANYVGLLLDATETSTGSGNNKLVDLRVGGTPKFSVTTGGDATATGTIEGAVLTEGGTGVYNETQADSATDSKIATHKALASDHHTATAVTTAGDGLTRTANDFDFDGGAAPSGELGGTWATPTVNGTHSGSAHHTKTTDASELSAGTIPADRAGADHIDTITEIAAALKDGSGDCGSGLLCLGDHGHTTLADTNAPKLYYWPAAATLLLQPIANLTTGASDGVAPITKDTDTNLEIITIAFDATADEFRAVTFEIPSDVSSASNVTITFKGYATTAAAQDVALIFAHYCVADGENWDGDVTEEALTTTLTNTQDAKDNITKSDETATQLDWVAGDSCFAYIGRDGDHSTDDGLTTDFNLTDFSIRIPRA